MPSFERSRATLRIAGDSLIPEKLARRWEVNPLAPSKKVTKFLGDRPAKCGLPTRVCGVWRRRLASRKIFRGRSMRSWEYCRNGFAMISSIPHRTVTTARVMYMAKLRILRIPFTYVFFGLSIYLSSFPGAAASAGKQCSQEMHDHAVSRLSEARGTWESLSKHQKKFAACDDGDLGEGYSEAVARLFSGHWSEVDSFVAIARHDPAFQKWAIRHIDATVSYADLSAIAHNASSCSRRGEEQEICELIHQAAEDALVGAGHGPASVAAPEGH
jgi:hypothetical protein